MSSLEAPSYRWDMNYEAQMRLASTLPTHALLEQALSLYQQHCLNRELTYEGWVNLSLIQDALGHKANRLVIRADRAERYVSTLNAREEIAALVGHDIDLALVRLPYDVRTHDNPSYPTGNPDDAVESI